MKGDTTSKKQGEPGIFDCLPFIGKNTKGKDEVSDFKDKEGTMEGRVLFWMQTVGGCFGSACFIAALIYDGKNDYDMAVRFLRMCAICTFFVYFAMLNSTTLFHPNETRSMIAKTGLSLFLAGIFGAYCLVQTSYYNTATKSPVVINSINNEKLNTLGKQTITFMLTPVFENPEDIISIGTHPVIALSGMSMNETRLRLDHRVTASGAGSVSFSSAECDEFHNETYPGPAFDIVKYVQCLPFTYNMQDCSTSYKMEGSLTLRNNTDDLIEDVRKIFQQLFILDQIAQVQMVDKGPSEVGMSYTISSSYFFNGTEYDNSTEYFRNGTDFLFYVESCRPHSDDIIDSCDGKTAPCYNFVNDPTLLDACLKILKFECTKSEFSGMIVVEQETEGNDFDITILEDALRETLEIPLAEMDLEMDEIYTTAVFKFTSYDSLGIQNAGKKCTDEDALTKFNAHVDLSEIAYVRAVYCTLNILSGNIGYEHTDNWEEDRITVYDKIDEDFGLWEMDANFYQLERHHDGLANYSIYIPDDLGDTLDTCLQMAARSGTDMILPLTSITCFENGVNMLGDRRRLFASAGMGIACQFSDFDTVYGTFYKCPQEQCNPQRCYIDGQRDFYCCRSTCGYCEAGTADISYEDYLDIVMDIVIGSYTTPEPMDCSASGQAYSISFFSGPFPMGMSFDILNAPSDCQINQDAPWVKDSYYEATCCLEDGDYIAACHDEHGYGWGNAELFINDRMLCEVPALEHWQNVSFTLPDFFTSRQNFDTTEDPSSKDDSGDTGYTFGDDTISMTEGEYKKLEWGTCSSRDFGLIQNPTECESVFAKVEEAVRNLFPDADFSIRFEEVQVGSKPGGCTYDHNDLEMVITEAGGDPHHYGFSGRRLRRRRLPGGKDDDPTTTAEGDDWESQTTPSADDEDGGGRDDADSGPSPTACTLPQLTPDGYDIDPTAIITGCTSADCTNPIFTGVSCASGYSGIVSTTACSSSASTVTLTGCTTTICTLPPDAPMGYSFDGAAVISGCDSADCSNVVFTGVSCDTGYSGIVTTLGCTPSTSDVTLSGCSSGGDDDNDNDGDNGNSGPSGGDGATGDGAGASNSGETGDSDIDGGDDGDGQQDSGNVDCDGVPDGPAVEDECGVCQGDGTSCADCEGVPNGLAVVDACGVCQGDGSSCADCEGAPNGLAVEDACGVCQGDGSSCDDDKDDGGGEPNSGNADSGSPGDAQSGPSGEGQAGGDTSGDGGGETAGSPSSNNDGGDDYGQGGDASGDENSGDSHSGSPGEDGQPNDSSNDGGNGQPSGESPSGDNDATSGDDFDDGGDAYGDDGNSGNAQSGSPGGGQAGGDTSGDDGGGGGGESPSGDNDATSGDDFDDGGDAYGDDGNSGNDQSGSPGEGQSGGDTSGDYGGDGGDETGGSPSDDGKDDDGDAYGDDGNSGNAQSGSPGGDGRPGNDNEMDDDNHDYGGDAYGDDGNSGNAQSGSPGEDGLPNNNNEMDDNDHGYGGDAYGDDENDSKTPDNQSPNSGGYEGGYEGNPGGNTDSGRPNEGNSGYNPDDYYHGDQNSGDAEGPSGGQDDYGDFGGEGGSGDYGEEGPSGNAGGQDDYGNYGGEGGFGEQDPSGNAGGRDDYGNYGGEGGFADYGEEESKGDSGEHGAYGEEYDVYDYSKDDDVNVGLNPASSAAPTAKVFFTMEISGMSIDDFNSNERDIRTEFANHFGVLESQIRLEARPIEEFRRRRMGPAPVEEPSSTREPVSSGGSGGGGGRLEIDVEIQTSDDKGVSDEIRDSSFADDMVELFESQTDGMISIDHVSHPEVEYLDMVGTGQEPAKPKVEVRVYLNTMDHQLDCSQNFPCFCRSSETSSFADGTTTSTTSNPVVLESNSGADAAMQLVEGNAAETHVYQLTIDFEKDTEMVNCNDRRCRVINFYIILTRNDTYNYLNLNFFSGSDPDNSVSLIQSERFLRVGYKLNFDQQKALDKSVDTRMTVDMIQYGEQPDEKNKKKWIKVRLLIPAKKSAVNVNVAEETLSYTIGDFWTSVIATSGLAAAMFSFVFPNVLSKSFYRFAEWRPHVEEPIPLFGEDGELNYRAFGGENTLDNQPSILTDLASALTRRASVVNVDEIEIQSGEGPKVIERQNSLSVLRNENPMEQPGNSIGIGVSTTMEAGENQGQYADFDLLDDGYVTVE